MTAPAYKHALEEFLVVLARELPGDEHTKTRLTIADAMMALLRSSDASMKEACMRAVDESIEKVFGVRMAVRP